MNFDFPALLVFLTFASGIIWLGYSIFHKQLAETVTATDGAAGEQRITEPPLVVEYAKSFFPVFLIVLILRSFIVEPFNIPSASMMPTLLIGDFILVNKYEYGLRLPVLHTKIIENETPARGDIVVFRYPEDPSIPFIKRVVGLPGDKIDYINKVLHINGEAIEQIDNGKYQAYGAGFSMNGTDLKTELLPENATHDILVDPERFSHNIRAEVPEGHYFVVGDNRDNSKDSRFWGFVPDENLMGRAFMIWMNWDSKNSGIDFSRIGTMMQ